MGKSKSIENRIIQAAAKVFLEKGYEGTNMTLIAEAAGIGRPALYYYFKTKGKVFEELYASQVKSFTPGLLEIISQDAPSEKKIEQFVEAYFEQLIASPELPFFILREIHRDSQFFSQTATKLNLDKYFTDVLDAYRKEVEAGHLKDVPVYALIITMIGDLLSPFAFKPMIETLVMGKAGSAWAFPVNSFKDILLHWKPFVIKNMKSLLLPDEKTSE